MAKIGENIYQQNGYESRQDYLEYLADVHGMELWEVEAISDSMGESEDFDGLVLALEDW